MRGMRALTSLIVMTLANATLHNSTRCEDGLLSRGLHHRRERLAERRPGDLDCRTASKLDRTRHHRSTSSVSRPAVRGSARGQDRRPAAQDRQHISQRRQRGAVRVLDFRRRQRPLGATPAAAALLRERLVGDSVDGAVYEQSSGVTDPPRASSASRLACATSFARSLASASVGLRRPSQVRASARRSVGSLFASGASSALTRAHHGRVYRWRGHRLLAVPLDALATQTERAAPVPSVATGDQPAAHPRAADRAADHAGQQMLPAHRSGATAVRGRPHLHRVPGRLIDQRLPPSTLPVLESSDVRRGLEQEPRPGVVDATLR